MFVVYSYNDPSEGFDLYGPFESYGVAVAWAEKELKNSAWAILKVHAPEDF